MEPSWLSSARIPGLIATIWVYQWEGSNFSRDKYPRETWHNFLCLPNHLLYSQGDEPQDGENFDILLISHFTNQHTINWSLISFAFSTYQGITVRNSSSNIYIKKDFCVSLTRNTKVLVKSRYRWASMTGVWSALQTWQLLSRTPKSYKMKWLSSSLRNMDTVFVSTCLPVYRLSDACVAVAMGRDKARTMIHGCQPLWWWGQLI